MQTGASTSSGSLLQCHRKTLAAVLGVAAAFAGTAHPASYDPQKPFVQARYLMGSRCEIRAFAEPRVAERAAEAAFARMALLERAMTTWHGHGELAAVNDALRADQHGPVAVSDDLAAVLAAALQWADRTGGRFDPTSGALAGAWGLRDGGRIPTDPELAHARSATGWSAITVDPATSVVHTTRPGLSLDLGAFGKGWALDEAARVLQRHGVASALIDFGGQVLALAAPPGEDGWVVDLADPADRQRSAASLRVAHASVATSSNLVKSFPAGGPRVGHVLDPRTGHPARFQGSATVIAPSAAAADALSTALLVEGPAGDRGFIPPGAQALFLESDPRVEGGVAASGSPALLAAVGLPPADGARSASHAEAGSPTPDGGESVVPADGERRGEQRIDELERRMEILADELESLRRGEAIADADERRHDDSGEGKYGLAPSASKVYRVDRGVSLGGYAEWLYEGFDSRDEAGQPSGLRDRADFLRLVLYAGYKFSDSVLFNSEIEFEHASTGADGEVSVELAYLDFMIDPRVNVRTGLVLVPVGLVNEQHEPPTFLGSRRPDVETSILPTTWRELGAGIFGEAGPVSYRAYVLTGLDGSGFGAASAIRGGRQKGSKAIAEDLAFSGRVDLTGVPGLLAGVSFFHGGADQGATIDGQPFDADVTTFDLHAEWRWRGLELRGLAARIEIDGAEPLSVLTGETIGSRASGWYLQAGWDTLSRRPTSRHQLIPFVRYESLDTQERVAPALIGTVTGENDRSITTWGVVYKPLENVAIKADYQRVSNRARSGVDRANVAVGLYF